ncbi:unnamed protein product [Angiostrongylus costaricensis]|uniref:Peroxinectin n=1 Tax=Angiostrongylus costaricensis TaxID=334426 RepID=A0A158PJI3_ANGCS|nr:unnamed protein product [Angiostrongylus costaricensis]
MAAEEMWREDLIVSTEDNSNRTTVNLDSVIRSNLANACVPRMDETSCEKNICYNVYFRTMDGSCNNLRNPLRGAAYRPYTRLLPTVYDNGLSEPVGSLFPELRPSPRVITRQLTSSHASVVSDEYNALVMQFGQFISHDIAKKTYMFRLDKTRTHYSFNAASDTGDELFLGKLGSRTVGGVCVFVNTSLAVIIEPFEQPELDPYY